MDQALPPAILFDLDDTILSFATLADEAWKQVVDRYVPKLPGVTAQALLPALLERRDWYWSDPERHRRGRLGFEDAYGEIVRQAFGLLGISAPGLATEIAKAYGAQCVVLSIDARKTDGGYEVYSACGGKATGMDPAEWAKQGEELGAGEIMITSIERDGSLQGYDLELCRRVSDAVSVPVLVLGGAGSWKHFVEGVEEGGASAVCTQNIYHFTENSILSAKKFLAERGVPVRL